MGPRIFLYTPQKSMHGQPILLCTWLGAVHRHTAKYTILCRCITPNARILLLESSFGILIVLKQRVMVFNTLAECEALYPPHPKHSVNGCFENKKTSPRNFSIRPRATQDNLAHLFKRRNVLSDPSPTCFALTYRRASVTHECIIQQLSD